MLQGYFPGAIGLITEAHAVYYHEYWGFDISFETQVGRELSEFMTAFQEGRDGFWVATAGGRFDVAARDADGRDQEHRGRRGHPGKPQRESGRQRRGHGRRGWRPGGYEPGQYMG